ncbi:hypothetical protein, partial [Mucilaginibacter psychrotolerans]|uniref:hypothetical protein n=1 Tax=Mucilaginibacter psychrotolerans TaxID=1524096 RepID=UPI00195A4170
QKSRLSGLLQEALEILPFSSSDLLKSMLNLFFPPTFLLDPLLLSVRSCKYRNLKLNFFWFYFSGEYLAYPEIKKSA